MRADKAVEAFCKAPCRDSTGPPITYPGHLNPVVQDFGPVLGPHAWVPKAGGDHTGGHRIELRDGGTHSRCRVFVARLVPLGPDGAQALVWQHLFEQLLGERGCHPALPHPRSGSLTSFRRHWSGLKARKLRMCPEPWGPWDSFSIHKGPPAQDPRLEGKGREPLPPAHPND